MRAQEVAQTIRQQIGLGVLWSLGATALHYGTEKNGNPFLGMAVRILPYRKDGKRGSRPRVMRLRVELTPADLYDITVEYTQRNRHTGDYEKITHFTATDVYCDQLSRLLLTLDSDSDRV